MSETVSDVAGAADSAGRQTVRVPANVLRLIRQSYDTREKTMDWLLAISVVAALAYIMRDEIRDMINPNGDDPNAGRPDDQQVNQDVAGAWAPYGGLRPSLYTYAMPVSRGLPFRAPPTGMRPPDNPSLPPSFSPPES
jgi:hypothetical protein